MLKMGSWERISIGALDNYEPTVRCNSAYINGLRLNNAVGYSGPTEICNFHLVIFPVFVT